MIDKWDGNERRKMGQFDQEIITKIVETHTNVANLVKNFDGHVLDDKKYWDKVDSINVRIAKWTGAGTALGSAIGFILSKIIK